MRQCTKKTELKKCLIAVILLAICIQDASVAAEPSRSAIEAVREVTTDPNE